MPLRYPIIYPLSRRYDRRLPMHDKVLHGALHEFLRVVVQRKHRLHDIPKLGPSSHGARAPEKKAQAAELPLEFLVPRSQQKAERVVDGGGLRHWDRSQSEPLQTADGSVGRLCVRSVGATMER
jgi:hypothetical protein